MWELDHKESWAPKNWCFWTVVLEKTLESPLDCKEIQPVHPKGNQSWILLGRTDVEAETPKLWPPDAKSWLIWKDPDAGKDWGWEEKGTTENEKVGWHHRLNEWIGKPGMLQSTGSQRVRHNCVAELNFLARAQPIKTMDSVTYSPLNFLFLSVTALSFPFPAGTCRWIAMVLAL